MDPGKIINGSELIFDFIHRIKDDPRISAAHISLYVSLVNHWQKYGRANPIYVFSRQIMPASKISGVATYHKSIRQLNEYGYIKYVPSYNRFVGSLVYMNV